MPRWIFIRHGQSRANAEAWFAGHLDSPLTELGCAQARELREALRARTIAAAFSSDLQRARDTAQLALEGRGIPVVTTPQLRERSLGAWEGRPIAEIEASGEISLLQTWEGRAPGGESLRDTAARAAKWCAQQRLACGPAEGDMLVVAHGALLRALIGLLDGVPKSEIGRWHPYNCQLIERDIEPDVFDRIAHELA